MKIKSIGTLLIMTSTALALLLAATLMYSPEITRQYFQMIEEHPLWASRGVPALILFALLLAFIRTRKKRSS